MHWRFEVVQGTQALRQVYGVPICVFRDAWLISSCGEVEILAVDIRERH